MVDRYFRNALEIPNTHDRHTLMKCFDLYGIIYVCKCAGMCACVHVRLCVFVCEAVGVCVCAYVCVCACVCVSVRVRRSDPCAEAISIFIYIVEEASDSFW